MTSYSQASWTTDGEHEPVLNEKDSSEVEVDTSLPDDMTRDTVELPSLEEPTVARHYTRLSQMNYGIESGPYPLGSCTMKYNPKFTEDLAALPEAHQHPDVPEEHAQGSLELMHELQGWLSEIGGMDAVSLQPPAGASGELAGLLVAKKHHELNDDTRSEVVIPDSAHGTNFASAAMAGFDVVELPSGDDGRVDLDALEAAVGEETALFMLTNPNTLGLFEREIESIAETVHGAGGLLYYDGANLNAMLGHARPGDMGFDIMHFNLHKTFATPHGGGGPGQGPIGVKEDLKELLPSPVVEEVPESDGADKEGGREYRYREPQDTVGKLHGYHGNWLVLVKAYAYISRLGGPGLRDACEKAVLNANYLRNQIEYEVPHPNCHHEFVASAGEQDAADVAKRMLDFGVHPPTTKWPQIVDEALMTEPTEVETRETLDVLADAFNRAREEDDEALENAPETTTAARIDQVSAARNPRLSWHALKDD
ncbi:MAG: aminomethyl-transferring glycine dehydrogenase subunit GcvPB [Halobacteria archaeon]